LGYVTHLTESVVRVADGGIVDRARRTTSVGVEQTVVGPDHVRPRPTTDDSVTIVHDATQITVLVVVAVVASRLTHAQPDTLRQIKFIEQQGANSHLQVAKTMTETINILQGESKK